MQLNYDDIQEFKKIYRAEFGEELSDTEADRRARQLLTFYEVILQILPKDPQKQLKRHRRCGSCGVDLEPHRGIVHGACPISGPVSNPAASESAEAPPQQTHRRPPSL